MALQPLGLPHGGQGSNSSRAGQQAGAQTLSSICALLPPLQQHCRRMSCHTAAVSLHAALLPLRQRGGRAAGDETSHQSSPHRRRGGPRASPARGSAPPAAQAHQTRSASRPPWRLAGGGAGVALKVRLAAAHVQPRRPAGCWCGVRRRPLSRGRQLARWARRHLPHACRELRQPPRPPGRVHVRSRPRPAGPTAPHLRWCRRGTLRGRH